jgi:hypothetical protein
VGSWCSKRTRKVVAEGRTRCACRVSAFAEGTEGSEDTSADCSFLAVWEWAKKRKEKPSQRGGCLSDSK